MHTGYYSLNSEDDYYSCMKETNFSDVLGESIDMYKYLHGFCDDFACALNRKFGYDIVSIWSANDRLIHAYCEKPAMFDGDKNYFIDARGITDNWQEFIEEFRDEYSDDLYDEPECTIAVNHTADDFIDMCVIEKGKDWNYVESPETVAELKEVMNSPAIRNYNVLHVLRNKERYGLDER